MLKLVKNLVEESGKIVRAEVLIENCGKCSLVVENKLIKKYKELDQCLLENDFLEFLKGKGYDEYRD